MAYNLIVAYDLMYPGQNYDAVRHRIKSLGQWYQFQYSLFYLKTELTAEAAHDAIRASMDANDRLVVVNALDGVVSYYPIPDIQAVNVAWLTPAMRIPGATAA